MPTQSDDHANSAVAMLARIRARTQEIHPNRPEMVDTYSEAHTLAMLAIDGRLKLIAEYLAPQVTVMEAPPLLEPFVRTEVEEPPDHWASVAYNSKESS